MYLGLTDVVQGASQSPTPPVEPPSLESKIISRLFNMIDHTGSGTVDVAQLAGLGESVCRSWHHSELLRIAKSAAREPFEAGSGGSGLSSRLSMAEFHEGIVCALETCFERLDLHHTGRIEPGELQEISFMFKQDHEEMMSMFDYQIVGVAQFVRFVLEHCVRGVDYREAVAGLSKVVQMGARKLIARNSPPRTLPDEPAPELEPGNNRNNDQRTLPMASRGHSVGSTGHSTEHIDEEEELQLEDSGQQQGQFARTEQPGQNTLVPGHQTEPPGSSSEPSGRGMVVMPALPLSEDQSSPQLVSNPGSNNINNSEHPVQPVVTSSSNKQQASLSLIQSMQLVNAEVPVSAV